MRKDEWNTPGRFPCDCVRSIECKRFEGTSFMICVDCGARKSQPVEETDGKELPPSPLKKSRRS